MSRMRDLTIGAIQAFAWSSYGLDPLTDGSPSTWPDDLADAILNMYQIDGEVEPGDDENI